MFDEQSIFASTTISARIAIKNLLYFRFANSLLSRSGIATSSKACRSPWRGFRHRGRGRFYDDVGCIRDVIENHLLNILLLLAMEPPVGRSADDLIDEKVQVLRAIRTLTKDDVVRGQFKGYLTEPGVAPKFAGRNLRGGALLRRHMALAGCAVLHPRRQEHAGSCHRWWWCG